MKWSGLLEVAEKGGFIRKPKVGMSQLIPLQVKCYLIS
jgi:hypothetical protein